MGALLRTWVVSRAGIVKVRNAPARYSLSCTASTGYPPSSLVRAACRDTMPERHRLTFQKSINWVRRIGITNAWNALYVLAVNLFTPPNPIAADPVASDPPISSPFILPNRKARLLPSGPNQSQIYFQRLLYRKFLKSNRQSAIYDKIKTTANWWVSSWNTRVSRDYQVVLRTIGQ